MKEFELRSIRGCTGNYKAVMYNRLGGYYKEVNFLWYSKKAMFRELRNGYDCSVAKCFEQGYNAICY